MIDNLPIPIPRELQFAALTEYVITRDLFHTHVYIVTQHATVSQPLRTLIDTGFSGGILISTRVAESLKLKMCPIELPVRLADKSYVKASYIVRDTPVIFSADYMESCNILVLPELTYDVIVGQAWLARHKARLECSTNMLTCCSLTDPQVTVSLSC
jgi:predicted aspartyl protease